MSGRQGTSTKSNASKDGTDRLLVNDEEIKGRWREYFDKLFNGENEGPTLELDELCEENSGGRDRGGFEEDEGR